MYERICVSLDGSELAEVALPYAEELAARLGCEVTLVHVSERDDAEQKRMQETYLERVVELVKQGAERCPGKAEGCSIRVKSALMVGNAAEEIVDCAEREDIGLIIMATHGRSGIKRWLLGGVADKVVRATDRPVVLIRAAAALRDVEEQGGLLKTILVTLDGSDEAELVVPYVEELASKLSSQVILLQVVVPAYFVYTIPGETVQMFYPPEEIELLQRRAGEYLEGKSCPLRDKGITVRTEVRVGGAAEEVIGLADEISADMVAMSTHGRSGVGRWALGSTADKVVRGGNSPVLLVRAREAGGQ